MFSRYRSLPREHDEFDFGFVFYFLSFYRIFSCHFMSVSFLGPFLPSFALIYASLYNSLFSPACSGVRLYHGYVPGVISLQVTRGGIPQVAIVALPSRTGTAVHVLFCLFSSIETFIVACVLTPG